ncbi:hypothetical protein DOTSEDRAFT_27715 [Dothistroma septosporum NZE10]|uniref:BTB domain-containing protein n=1 Tax=Dothistroma septosporum (strain NZE10 / CBS 128990) TaxID=675120 RepID=N1PBT4_DOTSN|nr:hypothetical protein DOTSEDRAFT_27715 [Dothistroma septosporum NZE10]
MSVYSGSTLEADISSAKMDLRHSFKCVTQSRPIRFLIGPNNESYFVHPALISKHTSALNARIDGITGPPTKVRIVLSDLEEDTWVNFLEYIYLGYYTPVEHTIIKEIYSDHEDDLDSEAEVTPPTTVDETEPVPESWLEPVLDPGFGFGSKSKKKGRKTTHAAWDMLDSVPLPVDPAPAKLSKPEGSKQGKTWAAFQARHFEVVVPSLPLSARANRSHLEDYTCVFLGHAKLFVLATSWGVEHLPELALRGLHETLVNFTLYHERTVDIARLLEYCYNGTWVEQDGHSRLQDLVMDFVACNITKLIDNDGFQDVLRADNSAGVALMKKLVKHLI